IPWSAHFAERFAGTPLKRIAVTSRGKTVRGEAVVTRNGLEGGAVYALNPEIRQSGMITLDLRPDLSLAALGACLARPKGKASHSTWLRKAAGLSPVTIALLREAGMPATATIIKALPLTATGTDALTRAISSAGGIALSELDRNFEFKAWPGVFAAGEML